MKDRLLTLLKITISLGLIVYLLFIKVDISQVIESVLQAKVGYLLLALALYFVAIAVGCYKWKLLLSAQEIHLPYRRLLSFTFEGLFFGNILFPLIAGDLVRGYDLARDIERTADAAVSVLIDKLVGLSAFITAAAIMSAYALWGMGRTDLSPLALTVFLAFLAFVALFACMLSRRLRGFFEKVFELPLFSRLAPISRELSVAFQAYRNHPGTLVKAFLISSGVLLITNFVNWTIVQATGAGIPLLYIFLFNPMIAFAPILIPSIGGLGVNQGAFDLFYVTLGGTSTSELTLTFSLIMQFNIYISSLPGGILWMRKRRPTAAQKEPAEPQPVEDMPRSQE